MEMIPFISISSDYPQLNSCWTIPQSFPRVSELPLSYEEVCPSLVGVNHRQVVLSTLQMCVVPRLDILNIRKITCLSISMMVIVMAYTVCTG